MRGAAYVCWVGIKALRDAWRGIDKVAEVAPARRRRPLAKAFAEGLATNALNPKVSMFYLAAFPQFIPLGEGAAPADFLLVCVNALLNAIWFSVVILLFARLMRAARSARFQRRMQLVTGGV